MKSQNMKNRISSLSLFTILLIVTFCSCQEKEKTALSLIPLFSDHMVLQQQEDVNIWGTYTAGDDVVIQGSWGASVKGVPDKDGNWKAQLETPAAGGPYEIEVITTDSIISFSDVMIGEVWIGSGQSNMQMPLKGWPPNDPILNSVDEIANANYNGIRMFTAAMAFSAQPQTSLIGDWEVCNPANAADFSATAYFFARRLHQELKVPIGIIHTSWGGTVAEAWTSSEALKTMGDFDGQLAAINDPEAARKTTEWYDRWVAQDMPKDEQGWSNLSFADEALAAIDYDDADWELVELPGRIDAIEDFELDGAVWLRKSFIVDDLSQDFMLTLGAIDDADVTFVNGHKVGAMNAYNLERNYKIDKSILRKGENVIAIRAVDTGGPGSVTGDITLSNDSKSISLKGSWYYLPVAEIYNGHFYKYDLSGQAYKERPNISSMHQNMPTALYNAMVAPIVGYNVQGAIWYQGESNVGRAKQYETLFPLMIKDWRKRWQDDFSFYYVQIAPFRYQREADASKHLSQKLRDAQRKTLILDGTGMVVTMDIGHFTNIHPGNKQDVGSRLAGLALAHDYNKEIVASGPLYKSHSIDGSEATISFDHIGSGLMKKSKLEGFEIAGQDGVFAKAKAKIVDDQVVLSSTDVKVPAHVRYAWSDDPVASLFNQEGLPASSFSSN